MASAAERPRESESQETEDHDPFCLKATSQMHHTESLKHGSTETFYAKRGSIAVSVFLWFRGSVRCIFNWPVWRPRYGSA